MMSRVALFADPTEDGEVEIRVVISERSGRDNEILTSTKSPESVLAIAGVLMDAARAALVRQK
jgi:hypothetical protein